MLFVEIHSSGFPIIYRSKRFASLVKKAERIKVYKFACKAQAVYMVMRNEFMSGQTILEILLSLSTVPEIHHVQRRRMRAIVKRYLPLPPREPTGREFVNVTTDFNSEI